MRDFTADHIDQSEADALIGALNDRFVGQGSEFHAGVSYRNLMLLSDAADLKLTCQAPHDIPGQPVAGYAPRGDGAERVVAFMRDAHDLLADHPVNAARREAGRVPVTDIWLWGQGRPTVLESFQERHGVSGVVITGVDIIRGLAVSMGMELIEVPGATGYLDTNYAGKGRAAAEALARYDLVVAHVEAPDEAGHEGSAAKKVEAIERTDALMVGPVLEAVRIYPEWRILVAPDHPTPVSTKAHSATPPLFAMAGTGIGSEGEHPFHDRAAEASGWFLERGHELMDQFMARPER
jgi:2,3-bisphosphoglycerate-independent phosphoglycerate mutase